MNGNPGRCLECGEEFTGRSDKKFCCDYCRNVYNNRRNHESRQICELTNRRLAKNRRVLMSMESGWSSLAELERRGFSKSVFTGTYFRGFRRVYVCYDIKYTIMLGKLIIVRE